MKLARCCQSNTATLRRRLRGDLDWITLKAMEKDRMRRYQTAHALAEDIERHLHDEPVSAGRPGTLYRFQKLARRNKGVFTAAAVVAAVLVLGALVSTWQAVRATQAQRAEIRLRQEAETARRGGRSAPASRSAACDGRGHVHACLTMMESTTWTTSSQTSSTVSAS
ncbi:MAG: hypothetical protein M1376_21955 [Planctomycetes bacterium]|nr:hypothetical protein [Planctomycetota bacterium]